MRSKNVAIIMTACLWGLIGFSMVRAGTVPISTGSAGDSRSAAESSKRSFAKNLLQSNLAPYLSGWGRSVLENTSGTTPNVLSLQGGPVLESVEATELEPSNIKSRRVNDPNQDLFAADDISTQSETAVAAFGQNVIVSFNDSGQFLTEASFMGYSRSTDGGATFTDMGVIHPFFPGAENDGDPGLVANRLGDFYASSISYNPALPSPFSVAIQKSTDAGANFGPPTYPPPYVPNSFADKDFMAVDNSGVPFSGDVYVTWTNFGPPFNELPIVFSRSTDGGASFSPPIRISVPGSFNQGSEPVVGPNGEIYVAWFQFSSPTGIVIAKSTNGGVSFGSQTLVASAVPIGFTSGNLLGNFRSNSFPRIDVNPLNGDVYIVYASNPPGPDAADVFFTRSTDGGASWSSPTRVNDDNGAADQWFPDLAVNNQGVIRVFWYDRRRHSNKPDDLLIDLYSAGSDDGGASFSTNQRINHSGHGTNAGMLPAVGYDPLVNPIYMGDYIDIKVDTTPTGPGQSFFSAWGDFNRLVTTDGGTRSDQDVAFARQDFSSLAGPSADGSLELEHQSLSPSRGATIAFVVSEGAAEPVEIGIYDVTGRLVGRVANGVFGPGRHEIPWDGRTERGDRAKAGMYFARAINPTRPVVCSSRILYLK